jgi:hypothetical protein
MAPTVGFVGANVNLKAVPLEGGPTVVADSSRQKMILNVWPFNAGPGPNKTAGFKMIGRTKTGLGQHPLRANPKLGKQSEVPIHGDGLSTPVLKVNLQMVLQVLPHTRQVVANRHPGREQRGHGPHAGALQYGRRTDGSRAENNLPLRVDPEILPVPAILHARDPQPRKGELVNLALVRMVRLGRRLAGSRYAKSVEQRSPLRTVMCIGPNPS